MNRLQIAVALLAGHINPEQFEIKAAFETAERVLAEQQRLQTEANKEAAAPRDRGRKSASAESNQ